MRGFLFDLCTRGLKRIQDMLSALAWQMQVKLNGEYSCAMHDARERAN